MDESDVWNRYASRYLERHGGETTYHGWYSAWLARLPLGATVLEWGCGPGIMAHFGLSSRSDLRWLGFDAADAMVAEAEKWVPSGRFEVRHAEESWPEGRFDGVAAAFLLPYLSVAQRASFLARVVQALAPGGAVFLSWIDGGDQDRCVVETASTGERVTVHYHAESSMRADLQRHGMRPVDAFSHRPEDGLNRVYRGIVALGLAT